MLQVVRRLLELVRFSHTLFALPFALTSAALAWYFAPAGFDWLQLVGILLGMVLARSAAMAFNRLVDRDHDAMNPRTATRHLPAGTLSVAQVATFTAVCSLGFVAATALFLLRDNPWPLIFSVPVLLFVLAYSLTKRFTALCHFWLGLSLFLAPVAAWIAIRGLPAWPEAAIPLLLGGAVLFWVAGFDILYACQDVEFDRKARLRSVPALLGVANALRVALACHLVMLFLLGLLFVAANPPLGWVYLLGTGLVGVLLAYEHSLVSAADLSKVNAAFFQVNAVVSVGLFVIVLAQLAWTIYAS
jgi:4-hydroxybenzoate polyprenyltransferase